MHGTPRKPLTRSAIAVATTLGLILNELATNAMKHGFSDDAAPRFVVTMKRQKESEEQLITVSQNGRLFPEGVEIGSTGSSGLSLVHALVSQLRGSLELERRPCPTFRIRIPMEVREPAPASPTPLP